MPEVIVIVGGGRNVGKTFLADAIGKILTDCAVIKLGVHHPRAEKNQLFFERGTSYLQILKRAGQRRFLVIESGAILDDPDLSPDLVIFLPGRDGDKPGSEIRRAAAHIIRGEPLSDDEIEAIAARLKVQIVEVRRIIDFIESFD
ncbi:MAG: hypothetical protein JRH20_32340 [Deltaproteobacteria bacterium]|nr:hypothetical protein [Deltaproteobacteria bacterium]